jgi:hypothetical protein
LRFFEYLCLSTRVSFDTDFTAAKEAHTYMTHMVVSTSWGFH